MPLKLIWNKCKGDVWCNLLNVDLAHAHFDNMEGVYIIWHGSHNPSTVRVGQGVIRERLAAHRQDPDILAYQNFTLYVTWASVPQTQRDGVEKYLGETLNPKVGARLPNVFSIEVNLPW